MVIRPLPREYRDAYSPRAAVAMEPCIGLLPRTVGRYPLGLARALAHQLQIPLFHMKLICFVAAVIM